MLIHDMRFAPGIMGHFSVLRSLFGPPPELIVARQRQSVWVQRITHHHSALQLAVQFAMSVFGGHRAAGRVGSPRRAELRLLIAPPADARVSPVAIASTVAAVAPLPLLLSGVFRGRDDRQRQSAASHINAGTPRSQAAPRRSFLDAVAPLRRVLRGAHPGESEPRPAPAPMTESRRDARTDVKTGDRMVRAAESALDVNGLTDRVIQAIDRRIIAQRERMGRP